MTKRDTSKRRIALFGGTFNPIHFGHLRGAEEVREAFGLEEVIFIPASLPPHKMAGEIIDARHRLEMVKRATRKNPQFSASDIELKRPGKSYSIDTIRYFHEKHKHALYFILGKDAFLEIGTWKDFQSLFFLCNFIVMAPPGSIEPFSLPGFFTQCFRHGQRASRWIHGSGNAIFFKEINLLDISSTKVRDLVKKGKSARYLVPPEVEAYIAEHGLYRR